MRKNKNPSSDGLDELYNKNPEEENKEKEIYFNPEADQSDSLEKEKKASASSLDTLNHPRVKKNLFKKLTLFLLVICLIGVGFLIWQFVQSQNEGEGDDSSDVILTLEGPEEIISGETTEYKITLENKSPRSLKEAEARVRFPSNFVAQSFEPSPVNLVEQEEKTIKMAQYFWQFDSFPRGAKKEIIITGQTFDEIGAKQVITATLHYQPENFSSLFKTTKILESEVSNTLIGLDISSPQEVVEGAEFDYLIQISPSSKTNSTTTLENIHVFIQYPDDLSIDNIESDLSEYVQEKAPVGTNSSWRIEELDREKEIKITGALTGESGEYKELVVKVGYYSGDEFRLQAGESFITMIIKPAFSLSLKANNLTSENIPVNWTDEINYSLTYANEGEIELSDIILKLNFTGDDIINWLSIDCEEQETCDFLLTTSNDGATKTLLWTREQIEDLENLIPGKSGTLDLKLNLKATPPGFKENYHINGQAQADYKVENLRDSIQSESNQISLKIKTEIALKTEARYYTDEYLKIGSGPLPPLVGAATSFRIFWEIENGSNALKNIKLTTTLPENVSWINKTQTFQGKLEYNTFNRRVTWSINNLNANLIEPAKANFEISVTPTLDQIGEYLILTRDTNLEATDNFTSESITDFNGYLTSELENDLAAQGKGRVE